MDINHLSILAGTNKLSSAGVRLQPAMLILNRNYNGSFPYVYDIALIKVPEPLNFSSTIAPIDLLETDPGFGVNLHFTGWGWTSLAGENPDQLQLVNLTSIDPFECKARFGLDGGVGQVCTISPAGSGPCVNDGGGPVTYNGFLYGIDSYGNSDLCDGAKPDITSSVPFHYDWIRRVIAENSDENRYFIWILEKYFIINPSRCCKKVYSDQQQQKGSEST